MVVVCYFAKSKHDNAGDSHHNAREGLKRCVAECFDRGLTSTEQALNRLKYTSPDVKLLSESKLG